MSFSNHVITMIRLNASIGFKSALIDIGYYPDEEVIPVLNQLMSKGFELKAWISSDRLRVAWSQKQNGHLVDSEVHTKEWLCGIYTTDILPPYTFRETGLVM